MNITQTQHGDTRDGVAGTKGCISVPQHPPPTSILDESLDDPDGLTDDEEEASQSSRSRRCAVRKVPARRASQGNNSEDDFVDTPPPPLKKKNAAADKHKMPSGRAGLRPRTKAAAELARAPIQSEVCLVIFFF